MKPAQEKAKQLVDKFIYHTADTQWSDAQTAAKKCALICVEEILYVLPPTLAGYDNTVFPNHEIEFWNEVKQEIEKI